MLLILCSPARAQLLYEVSGNSAKGKSYIFATNPYVDVSYLDSIYQPEGRYSSPKGATPLLPYSQCERVVTEFALQDYEAIAVMRQAALLPDSIGLRGLFAPTDYEYIRTACLSLLDLDIDSLGRLKPSYLTELYRDELLHRWLLPNIQHSTQDTLLPYTSTPLLPISIYFEALAEEEGKPVMGLDNASETMYIAFDREPIAWQCQELKKVIDYPEKEVEQERIIRDLYLHGRLNDIAYQIARPDNETSVSYSDYKVFSQRNKQWVKRLTPYLKDGRTFVTLNAIYLGGDEGLLAQLRAAGFRVKAVKIKH